MKQRRLASVLTLAAAFGLVAAGCGGNGGGNGGNGGEDPGAETGTVISIGIAEPRHLLPPNTTETSGAQVLAALFSPLVGFDAENKPVLNVAESVESSDNKVWNVKIKDGWTFHNGEKVTSDSFIDAWNYGAYSPNGQGGNYFFQRIDGYADMNTSDPDGDGPKAAPKPKADKLTGLKKTDDLNFTITLSDPFADWKSVMGYTVFYPMPKAAFTDLKAYEEAPIGNGPFKLKGKWEHDKQVEVEAYDKYAGEEKPKVAGVKFTIYQDPATEYRDLLAGNHDVMKSIPTAELANAQTDLPERFAQSSSSGYQMLAFPTYDPIFKKVEIRKAISMAIDREAIVKTIFQGSQDVARSFVSPVVPGFRDNTCGEACELDAAKAKDLLAQGGGIPGNKLTITYNSDGDNKPWVDATCNQIQQNLGVQCTSAPEPAFADLLEKVDADKAVGMFRMGWIFDYPSMENYLGPLYACKGSSNYYGYCNEEFDKLVADGSKATTPEDSIKLWQQAEDILVRDLPVLPLRFGKNNFGWSENVKDVELDAFQRVNLIKIAPAG
ncbi:peptide ABC transporter substrate-binding protein [Tenggerimyces flavus]|uniref:ABC transporter substrate-binding protein n=1 Tax=Tenggerimyces flavus TaxID=1708749 RepID=A0ABV7Y652_9ACTN|nr:ABC transporter substrate-binding protein [Tenggerimyces flavus]MBM7790982.1 ABC-type oligopeptide transport system substrate-binding subunit [Tenggerimyces flavus]